MVSFKIAYAKYGVLTVAIPFYSGNSSFPEDISRRAANYYLRIMPLGASITKGQGIPGADNNGYRKFLRDQLRFDGWQVNMVGSQPAGTMQDNDSEGYPGAIIAEVAGHGRIPAAVMKEVARQLLQGLDYLHRECGIIHTDLKPSNILLDLDYSEAVISRYIEQTSVGTAETGTGGENGVIATPLSEVITTPLISEMDNIRVKIIDFGAGMVPLTSIETPLQLGSY
ncbi:hypothetical protein VE04_04346 [Pseudogymnoascus sp. 24MN13]|nr:hypothetical protein VE04_04346 [Pseudogymnoascus sp. 24MN13]